MTRPNVIILAGANGAGKSTMAGRLFAAGSGVPHYVNADVIAKGLSWFRSEELAFEAGRIMLDQLKRLAAQRVSFAFETTLATRSFAPWLQELRRAGYDFRLNFLWLPTAEVPVERVSQRVQQGGHHIPEDTIRRRYERGIRNFFELYRPLADFWTFYENTDPLSPLLLAAGMLQSRRLWSPRSGPRLKPERQHE